MNIIIENIDNDEFTRKNIDESNESKFYRQTSI
jgi:hypothetical protein